jgi:hypothetical protein
MKHIWRWLVGFALTLIGALLLRGQMIALWLRLPPPRNRFTVQRNLRVPMDDGITLATDHYAPVTRESCPTILIRCPYGRNLDHGLFGLRIEFVARRLAERGYHVLVQDVRGRFDSEGEFEPQVNERADGLATLAWLKRQAWYNGVLGSWGPSYLGMTQWAMADAPDLRAMFPMITTSNLYDIVFPDSAFDLGLILRWIVLLELVQKKVYRSLIWGALILFDMEWRIQRALNALPVAEAERLMRSETPPYFQRWLDNADPNSPLWREQLKPIDHRDVRAAVHLVSGWYDLFLRGVLNDYRALRAAGHQPYLTIGPWHHFSHMFLSWNTLKYALPWFDQHLKGRRVRLREQPVRLYVMSAHEWRDYPEYPPPSRARCLYLGDHHMLYGEPGDAPPDCFVYDPARPTPIVGGTQFALTAGPRDNRHLERRSDVLIYSTPVFDAPFEMIGAIRLLLFVQSSQPYHDVYARLVDIHPDGRAINICDGLQRVVPDEPNGDIHTVEIDMWATAYRVRLGHRLHLIIGGGAHPRWCRHTGGAHPLTDRQLTRVEHRIYHDSLRPSALMLPEIDCG